MTAKYKQRLKRLHAKRERNKVSVAELVRRADVSSYGYARRVYLGEVVGSPTLAKLEKAAARL